MSDVSPRLPAFRLTELAHGGGCGCKLAPAVLQQLLTGRTAALFPQRLVGTETSDDAAVWQLTHFIHRGLETAFSQRVGGAVFGGVDNAAVRV
jgi:hypothetical protein